MTEDALAFIANKPRAAVEWWARSFARNVQLSEHITIARVLGKYMMYLDMRDRSLAPHLALEGFWEMWITQAIARHVKKGMRCIDVGANFGYYTLFLADLVGESGYVMSWEPQPALVALLKESLRANGYFERCSIVGAAAGAATGTIKLYVPEDCRWGSASAKYEHDGELIETRVETLDAHSALPVDFIKIDAEGMEPEIWAGMSETIARSPKLVIAMEWAPGAYADPADFLKRIEHDGFRLQQLDADGYVVGVDWGKLVDKEADWQMLWLEHV